MFRLFVVCIAAIVTGLVPPCRGQCTASSGPPIKVASGPLTGALTVIDCAADGADISINIAGLSGARVLHIYNSDIADNPQFDIGRITISGVSSSLSSLAILVAGPFQAWNDSRFAPLAPGCANFGGLIISDSATLANTRCSISVSESIEHRGSDSSAPDVLVNQVVRIQATGPLDPQTQRTSTGVINANIVATGAAATFAETVPHIGHVRAGDKIIGRIEALSGDIGTIRVVGDPTVTPAPGGIRGDIMALGGKIGAIYSTGDIDSKNPSHLMRIHAMQNIDEIRTAPEQSTLQFEPVVQRNLIADIQAGINWTLVPLPGFPNVYLPENNAAIQNINVGGDIEGSIKAKNLSFYGNGFRSGIIANGKIAASIDIECNVEQVDIIASTFTSADGIKVGVRLEGSIVATAPEGRIPFVDVGHGISTDANLFALVWVRGFCGDERRPLSPTLTEPVNLLNPGDWYVPITCVTGGCIDSVIRADSIGEVRLAAMTIKFADVVGPGGDLAKPFPPRIESPVIDRLEVTDLRNGIIWSGNLDLQSHGVPDTLSDDTADNYANIASLDIGCVGYGGILWLDGANDVNIASDLLGKLQMSGLLPGKTIRIGGRLGDWTQFCGCETLGSTCLFPPSQGLDNSCVIFVEESARVSEFADGLNSDSFVHFGAATLEGQIIVNRLNSPAATGEVFWRGFIKRDGSPNVVLATDSTASTTIAPYYTLPSTPLGGGAVGLAPFHLYENDCSPPHDPYGVNSGYTVEQINGVPPSSGIAGSPAQFVMVRFYGPVKKNSSTQTWAQHIRVRARPFPPGCEGCVGCEPPGGLQGAACDWADVSSAFDVYGPGATIPGTSLIIDGRTIGLRVKNGLKVAPGVYMVNPVTETSIRCDDVTSATASWSLAIATPTASWISSTASAPPAFPNAKSPTTTAAAW